MGKLKEEIRNQYGGERVLIGDCLSLRGIEGIDVISKIEEFNEEKELQVEHGFGEANELKINPPSGLTTRLKTSKGLRVVGNEIKGKFSEAPINIIKGSIETNGEKVTIPPRIVLNPEKIGGNGGTVQEYHPFLKYRDEGLEDKLEIPS